VALSDLGGVAAAFVRRMNEADLTNESVAALRVKVLWDQWSHKL